jgi:hypothetical protein
MASNKREKQPASLPEPVEFMVTLPHGEGGHQVSFHPEDVLLVDSAGPGLSSNRSRPTTLVRLERGGVPAQYNVPLGVPEVQRRIREKLALLKADQVVAGLRRRTVQDVVDVLARQIIDHMETTLAGMLDKELPERMERFLMEFTRDEKDPGEEPGKQAPGEAREVDAKAS